MEHVIGKQVQRKGSKVVWIVSSGNDKGVTLFSASGFATRWISVEVFEKNWKILAP